MKIIGLITALLAVICAAASITVFLETGRDYNGDFVEFRDSLTVLNDEGVILHIPTGRIKVAVEEGKDITAEFLAKAKTGSSGDEHFLQESDYFVSETPPNPDRRTEVKLASLLKPGTEETEMIGEFRLLIDGDALKTSYWYRTRPAKPEDIRRGATVIFFGAINSKGNYIAPAEDKEARSGIWFIAEITNAATYRKGFVNVSGNATVETRNLRIVIR